MRSLPSIVTPGKPYAAARSARLSTGTPSRLGTDSAHRLSWTTKTMLSRWIPAKLSASCQTPFEVAPSPTKATATLSFFWILKARAEPVTITVCAAMVEAGVMIPAGFHP